MTSYYSCKLQVGANFKTADCGTMYTCERNKSGAYLVATDLPGCDLYEECIPVDGDYTCVCDPKYITIDGRCQREFLSIGFPDLRIHPKYSRTSVARTQINHLPWLIRTRFESHLFKKIY